MQKVIQNVLFHSVAEANISGASLICSEALHHGAHGGFWTWGDLGGDKAATRSLQLAADKTWTGPGATAAKTLTCIKEALRER